MAGVGAARIGGGAGNLGQGVGPRAGGTRALGHLVLGETHGVSAARVRRADIHALVAQAVAELGGRTVRIGEAADGAAAGHQVGGVSSELAGRTGAAGRVVLGDADSLGAALQGAAGGHAALQGRAAHLLLPTLGIRLTLVLGGQVAALPVLGVAAVAFKAVAEALVVAGAALGVLGAGEELADGGAAQHAHLVRLAHLVLAALLVPGAAGHGGQLAPPGQRVPHMGGVTLAEGAVVAHHALLRVAAAHDAARVHTAALAADVDAADSAGRTVRGRGAADLAGAARPQVQRVARESILADAGTVVVVRDAPGVGTALNVAARVHTAVLALHRLADLIVAAVQVGGAGGGLAAAAHIVSIALEASQTQTLAVLAHSIWAAPLGAAQVRHQRLVGVAALEWVPLVSGLTATVEAARSIDTHSVLATDVGAAALIDVIAAHEGVTVVPLLALAHLASVAAGAALGVVPALARRHHVHRSGGCAPLVRVATKAWVTFAPVGSIVHTVAVAATAGAAGCRQDRGHTQEVSISHESFSAEALVGVGVAGGVEAA